MADEDLLNMLRFRQNIQHFGRPGDLAAIQFGHARARNLARRVDRLAGV